MSEHNDLMGDDLLADEYVPAPRQRDLTRPPMTTRVIVLPPDPTSMAEKGRKLYLQNQIRQAFHQLAANNLDAVQSWLHKVAEDSPAKGVELFIELAKFSLPQLKETAVTVTQNGSAKTYRSSDEILQELNNAP